MQPSEKTKKLGRGLEALLGQRSAPATTSSAMPSEGLQLQKKIAVSNLSPSKAQPRRNFNTEQLEELAQSLKNHGVLQPLIVRPILGQSGFYEIIAGERRWRAAQIAKIHQLPVIIQDFTDQEALEVALVENLQRADLDAIEESEGYQRLMNEFSYTQEELAEKLGKSRSHIANLLRLLKLPDDVKKMVQSGELSMGHARSLVTAVNPSALAREIVDKNLSVRAVEALQKEHKPTPTSGSSKAGTTPVTKGADIMALEKETSLQTGFKVTINHKGKAGQIVLDYKDLDQLDEILDRLTLGQYRG